MATIYALTHTPTGKAYIGVTSNLSKRFREHRCLLNNRKHHAHKLQALWDEYGGKYATEDFVMVALQDANYAYRGAACETEQEWIDYYEREGLLLNSNKTSQGLGGEVSKKGNEASRKSVGNRWSPEANEKRRLSQLGKPKGHGAKISATKQAKKMLMI